VSAQPFDPTRFKAAQRADWSDAAAGWRRWWKTIEDGLGPVSDRLVDLAQLKSGDKVLDIATGIGEPAVIAARRVGRAGPVLAIDIAPGMLAIGRERANELRLDNIEFREADAEQVELPHESFDSVLSRFGLMFFPNLDAVLHRIRRTLIKGGRLAAAVWGRPERSPFTALPAQTLMRQLNLPPARARHTGPVQPRRHRCFRTSVAGHGIRWSTQRADDGHDEICICRRVHRVRPRGRYDGKEPAPRQTRSSKRRPGTRSRTQRNPVLPPTAPSHCPVK
jgi:SAM-dependent methyltransferase